MPNSSRTHRDEKVKTGKLLSEKSASFHGRNHPTTPPPHTILRRPKTDTDLLSGRKVTGTSPDKSPRLTKLLLNVTIQRSLGPVHVVMSSESTVGDLIASAVRQYVKEGRRPFLTSTDPSNFDLHYSSFSLESLDRAEKLMNLGSRNFFMCPAKTVTAADALSKVSAPTTNASSSSSSCSKEADRASEILLPWSKIMELFI